jgi:hypothetical protein
MLDIAESGRAIEDLLVGDLDLLSFEYAIFPRALLGRWRAPARALEGRRSGILALAGRRNALVGLWAPDPPTLGRWYTVDMLLRPPALRPRCEDSSNALSALGGALSGRFTRERLGVRLSEAGALETDDDGRENGPGVERFTGELDGRRLPGVRDALGLDTRN